MSNYTDFNGKKWSREDLIDKIMALLSEGPVNTTIMSEKLKISTSSLSNILMHMMSKYMVNRTKDRYQRYIYSKVNECLLADLLLPKASDIEKKYKKCKSKVYTPDDGTSKSMGGGHKVDGYGSHYLTSIYWDTPD